VDSIPLGLKAACSSWTQAAKPVLSDSGPMGGNPKLKVLRKTFGRKPKINNKYSNKQLPSLEMFLLCFLPIPNKNISKIFDISQRAMSATYL
jgi:hypothetical protein